MKCVGGAVDWAAWTFPVLVALAVWYLFRLDRDPHNEFKLVHFITDKDGQGSSRSLTYTGTFLMGSWLMWYVAAKNPGATITTSVALAVLGALLGGYVTGTILTQRTISHERVEIRKAQNPPPPAVPPAPAGPTTTISETKSTTIPGGSE